ncbi:EAL domain-containing protein [Kushneria phosphatilytica]|nr:EAL domain-containing protein [Kushneria phosphatilytica]
MNAEPGTDRREEGQEARRLKAVRQLALLDTPPEKRFDRLIRLAGSIFDVSIALITLIDDQRIWFKSRRGIAFESIPREEASFCVQSLREPEMLVVDDARGDARFASLSLVTKPPFVRFYAGAVLRSEEGEPLGTLCIMDNRPRELTERQRTILLDLARLAESEMRFSDVSSRERSGAQIRANRDPLLHCMTRQGMSDLLDEFIHERPVTPAAGWLLSVELHDWHALNLRYNAEVENELLIMVHDRLHVALAGRQLSIARAQPNRLVALIGSPPDEVLIAGVRKLLAEPCQVADHTITPRLRLWTVPVPQGITAGRELLPVLHYLDRQYPWPTDGLQYLDAAHWLPSLHRRRTIRQRLPRLFENDGLTMYYQPRLDLVPHRLSGLEALLRWQDDQLGHVSPLEILDIANEAGLSRDLDMWVVRRVIRQLVQWRDAGRQLVPVSINLLPDQLRYDAFAGWLADELQQQGIAGELLEFEILEHVVINDFHGVVANMRQLAALGVRFALDDFGTGYSALAYLNRMPVDVLKIDRAFIQSIVEDVQAAALVRSIIEIGHNAGLTIVAEGVETLGQYLILRAHGCHAVQGFLLAPPSAADTVSDWLEWPALLSPPKLAMSASLHADPSEK